MGLINAIKLANDYNQAKKLLKEKNINIDKARKVITSIIKGVDYLRSLRTQLTEVITKYNTMANKLILKLKRRIK